jgi:hypothetical protein
MRHCGHLSVSFPTNTLLVFIETAQRPRKGPEQAMPSRVHILRFFRDTEARLRELIHEDPSQVRSALLQLADEISVHATELKSELIAERLIF